MFLFNFFLALNVLRCSLPDKCTTSGMIAITFDDGPTGYTEEILDILEENKIKVTFDFTIQNIARGNIANIMRRAVEEGHCVGLRVNPIRPYDDMDKNDIKEDIESQKKVLEDEIGQKIKYARAPVQDGNVNPDVYSALLENKIIQTSYSYCFYYDAQDPDEAKSLLDKIMNSSNPKHESFIFLLHDEKERDFPLLEDIIEVGKKKGYKFVTMDECLEGYEPGSGPVVGKRGSALTSSSASAIMMVPICMLVFLLV